ncbi:hypothetical protein RF11_08644 [Thelohanellus kitauei]|uniref:Uncharacterized protein n=1 Tax=Thelohanellus kitauei TaxID=669202 RepID=A0A0C2J322_THEKT|nr:hypothetical protein RF11_08644 [Thelohanellus kitauei]
MSDINGNLISLLVSQQKICPEKFRVKFIIEDLYYKTTEISAIEIEDEFPKNLWECQFIVMDINFRKFEDYILAEYTYRDTIIEIRMRRLFLYQLGSKIRIYETVPHDRSEECKFNHSGRINSHLDIIEKSTSKH